MTRGFEARQALADVRDLGSDLRAVRMAADVRVGHPSLSRRSPGICSWAMASVDLEALCGTAPLRYVA